MNLVYNISIGLPSALRNRAHLDLGYRTVEEVLAARGVKPTLSPNLNTLALVEVIESILIQ